MIPGPFQYFCQNWAPSENQFFLNEEVTRFQCFLGILGGQVPRPYDGTIFERYNTLKGVPQAVKRQMTFLSTFMTA